VEEYENTQRFNFICGNGENSWKDLFHMLQECYFIPRNLPNDESLSYLSEHDSTSINEIMFKKVKSPYFGKWSSDYQEDQAPFPVNQQTDTLFDINWFNDFQHKEFRNLLIFLYTLPITDINFTYILPLRGNDIDVTPNSSLFRIDMLQVACQKHQCFSRVTNISNMLTLSTRRYIPHGYYPDWETELAKKIVDCVRNIMKLYHGSQFIEDNVEKIHVIKNWSEEIFIQIITIQGKKINLYCDILMELLCSNNLTFC
jgi:hypothetical protein